MEVTRLSIRTGFKYILVGGIVLFLAVFMGIRAGLAVRGTPDLNLTPEKLRNTTTMKIGDIVPSLSVRSDNGQLTDLQMIGNNKRTVIAVVLPGCAPCGNLLQNWQVKELKQKSGDIQFIMLAGVSSDIPDLRELAEYASDYPVYFCDIEDLRSCCDLTTFPSVVGIGADNRIRFVANAGVYSLDEGFFNKHL